MKIIMLIITLYDLYKNLNAYCHEMKCAVRCALGLKDKCDSRKFSPLIIFIQRVGQAEQDRDMKNMKIRKFHLQRRKHQT